MPVSTARECDLRMATLFTFVPSIILCIVAGTQVHGRRYYGGTIPAIYFGSLAAFISAASSSVILEITKRRALGRCSEESLKKQGKITFMFDAFMAAGYLALLCVTWTLDIRNAGSDAGKGMLLAYATMPLLFNWLVHLYLASSDILSALINFVRTYRDSSTGACPNCQHCRHQREMAQGGAKPDNKEGYSLLRAEEYDEDQAESSEPRISADV